jgi:hypothetical protein
VRFLEKAPVLFRIKPVQGYGRRHGGMVVDQIAAVTGFVLIAHEFPPFFTVSKKRVDSAKFKWYIQITTNW